MTDKSDDPLVTELIAQTIMSHAGLTEWDKEEVLKEVKAIKKALKENGYEIREI